MRSSTSFPGRDGLLHISKLGRGKRIDRVEDVLNLGDEVTVRVDDIDNSGKLSLSLAGDEPDGDAGGADAGARWRRRAAAAARAAGDRRPRRRASASVSGGSGGDVEVASFDDVWDSQAKEEFGDLGPGRGRAVPVATVVASVAVAAAVAAGGGGGGGGRRADRC